MVIEYCKYCRNETKNNSFCSRKCYWNSLTGKKQEQKTIEKRNNSLEKYRKDKNVIRKRIETRRKKILNRIEKKFNNNIIEILNNFKNEKKHIMECSRILNIDKNTFIRIIKECGFNYNDFFMKNSFIKASKKGNEVRRKFYNDRIEEIEKKYGKNFYEILYQFYIIENKGSNTISKILEISNGIVLKKLKEYNIKLKSSQEIHKGKRNRQTKKSKKILSKKALERIANGTFKFPSYTHHSKGGFRNDLNSFFRSTWEANFARILNHHNIKWLFEKKRFKLEKHFYIPDFYLPSLDIFVELKGYELSKKEKYKKFIELYPNKSLIVIKSDEYKIFENKYKPIIKNWE